MSNRLEIESALPKVREIIQNTEQSDEWRGHIDTSGGGGVLYKYDSWSDGSYFEAVSFSECEHIDLEESMVWVLERKSLYPSLIEEGDLENIRDNSLDDLAYMCDMYGYYDLDSYNAHEYIMEYGATKEDIHALEKFTGVEATVMKKDECITEYA